MSSPHTNFRVDLASGLHERGVLLGYHVLKTIEAIIFVVSLSLIVPPDWAALWLFADEE